MNRQHGVAGLQQKKVSLVSIIALIYCSVAAGAFGVEEMVNNCGPGMTVLFLIGLVIVWALPICFCISELSSLMPYEGGFYYWAKRSFGEFWGFQVGWWNAIGYHACGASYIVLSVNYLSSLLDISEGVSTTIKIAVVIIFAIINLLGIKEVGLFSTIFSIIILVAFALLTVVGFANFTCNPMEPLFPPDMTPLQSLGNGIGYGIWMYTGWECITFAAGEIKNSNVISKAILIVVPLIALSYILPTIAGLGSIGDWENWSTAGSEDGVGFATVLSRFVGPVAGAGFLVIAIIGQLSIYNTNIVGGSRVFFCLADDHMFPKFIKRVSKRRGVPYVGIISLSAITILLVQFSFQALILIDVITSLATYMVMGCSLIKMRIVVPIEKRRGTITIPCGRFGMCFAALMPIIVSVLALYLSGLDYFIVGMAFVAITGPLSYLICKRIFGGLNDNESLLYRQNPSTGLAYGDLNRISLFYLLAGIIAVAGRFVINAIEHSWGPEYYLEEYGDAYNLLSNYDLMMNVILIAGIIFLFLSVLMKFISKHIRDELRE